MILGCSKFLNFDKGRLTNFVNRIENENKKHTFRGGFRWKTGDIAQIATGVRTKNYKEHFSLKVVTVADIIILFGRKFKATQKGNTNSFVPDKSQMFIYWNGHDMSDNIKKLSIREGFKSPDDFIDWFWHETKKGKGMVVGQAIILHQIEPLSSQLPHSARHYGFIQKIYKVAERLYNGSKEERKQLGLIKWQSEWRKRILENRQLCGKK